jgi:hypothetical protein
MDTSQVIVTVLGAGLIVAVLFYFFGPKPRSGPVLR